MSARLRAPQRRSPAWGPLVGAGALALFLLIAIAGRSAAPYDPEQTSGTAYESPSRAHLLGTNDLGQDLLSAVLVGTRLSLFVGLTVATISTALAWSVGVLSGYGAGGGLLLAAGDVLLGIPLLPLLVLVVAYGGSGTIRAVIAMSLLTWPAFARIVRTQVRSTRTRDYVAYAAAAGAGSLRIAGCHILPETVPTIVTKFILTARWAVLVDANLSFLGLTDPAAVTWGNVLSHAFRDPLLFTRNAWLWSALPPAFAVVAVVLSLGLLARLTEWRARALPDA